MTVLLSKHFARRFGGSYTLTVPSPVRFAVVRKMLEADGWRLARINGSHHVFTKPGQRSFVIPVHRQKVSPDYVKETQKITGQTR
jgi:predicted RNA binding protein YcfA (HicA-like mRNA interferase family)